MKYFIIININLQREITLWETIMDDAIGVEDTFELALPNFVYQRCQPGGFQVTETNEDDESGMRKNITKFSLHCKLNWKKPSQYVAVRTPN